MSIIKDICCDARNRPWLFCAFIALFICVDIEGKLTLIPYKSPVVAHVTNTIILAISYSYIAAVFFHLIVNVIPFYRRKKSIMLFIRSQVWSIREKLRFCILNVLSPIALNCEYNKKEFCDHFENANLHDTCFYNNAKTKLTCLEESRSKIWDDIQILLVYREYIDDDLFDLLNIVQNSEFIKNGINPYPDIEDNFKYSYPSNQNTVGECIYELYESLNKYNRRYNNKQ